jgi:hypothetical protein
MSPDRHGGDCFNDVVAPIKRMTLIQGAGTLRHSCSQTSSCANFWLTFAH